jgi:uncharacterized membrane protein
MKTQSQKMKTKNLLGFFLAIACVLLLSASFVSANEVAGTQLVEVDGMNALTQSVSVVAGETITLEVWFTALESDSDVRVEAELEGEKVSEEAISNVFDVELGQRYKKTLTLYVPYELKDAFSDTITLSIEVDGKDHRSEFADVTLNVQRPSYNADIMSINTPSTNKAGDSMTVDVVLKNIGYNNLDELYLTVKIPGLEVERTAYVGDLERLDNELDEDDEDTVNVKLVLDIPYNAEEGLYTLEVEARNSDFTVSVAKQVMISNDFQNNLIVSAYRQIFGAGESAEYELLIVNPTDSVMVYRIVAENAGSLTLGFSDTIVAVQPDSSKAVTLTASALSAGEYSFDVTVLSGEEIVGQLTLSATVDGGVTANDAIVVLTIVLAIIFLVLLAVLIVLLKKRPEKAEEFGESYY